MVDHSKAQDHRRMAQLLLTSARGAPDYEAERSDLATAQVHATLAVADAYQAQQPRPLTQQDLDRIADNIGAIETIRGDLTLGDRLTRRDIDQIIVVVLAEIGPA